MKIRLGRILREIRKRRGLSPVELADILGISELDVNAIEIGQCAPSLVKLMIYAKLSEIPVWLIVAMAEAPQRKGVLKLKMPKHLQEQVKEILTSGNL